MSNDESAAEHPAVRGEQDIASTADYAALRDAIVERASAARERASRAVNSELVLLYWSIGRTILAEQERHSWGDDVVGLLARDLRADGRLGRGFSRRNLFYMRRFAALWSEEPIVQTLSAQIGWSHHQVLLDAFGDEDALDAWYAAKAVEHRWSVRQLKGQIDLKLHLRYGAATANYEAALGDIEGRAALAVTKDPYVLDFIAVAEDVKERELEDALVAEIPRFLRELGVGFAYYGRQQPLEVGGQEFFLDLLFYHHRLRRFVVIDLKIGEFEPEFAGKMALYLNAVDDQLRHGDDAESIGHPLHQPQRDRRQVRPAPQRRTDRRRRLADRSTRRHRRRDPRSAAGRACRAARGPRPPRNPCGAHRRTGRSATASARRRPTIPGSPRPRMGRIALWPMPLATRMSITTPRR